MNIFFTLDFEKSKYKYKYQALYHFIRDLILNGKVKIDTRLPSSREMAVKYNVNRNTVKQVFEMLIADGYVSSVEGSGTFVAYSPTKFNLIEKSSTNLRLSKWSKRIPSSPSKEKPIKATIDFGGAGFSPNLSHFPIQDWKKTIYEATRELNFLTEIPGYDSKGLIQLREAISAYIHRTRGMSTDPSQIIIINGVMQGIGILSQLLIDEGDKVVVEEPSFSSIQGNFITSGATLISAPIEPGGFSVKDWDSQLIYVTPSNQFPTGKVMSLEQRLNLLQWAKKKNAIIIEDDYDSEFRRKGRPIEPLKVLDYEDRVVFLGTFAKSILPHLRIGYAILPSDLVDEFLRARNLFGSYTTSALEQMAIALFIKSGKLERHLRRLNRIYSLKYEAFMLAIKTHLPDAFDWLDTDAGLHLFASWKHSSEKYKEFTKECLARGVQWESANEYYLNPPKQQKAIFGFSHLDEQEIEEAVKLMGEVFEKVK
ncbi:PLP-dependent aminotransferase family protein [Bacillus luteolus]|uniref:PLP-dependent aminotransferase family protein n=1 Tax=Litchfieldia luteola TaxID=682179 RepID=A0ABR9QER7_9BACI|nr:PLP-dependent aminotransferase family protein [Cytobacillus luteolus]MBE4906734.1 PLP-dependent aminotransferase family protein [Cytobacillus luteolus]MBP1940616.1 GntR family transcriptional regulator/MocR family aminotransferase [Cytobacillus luteolus]